MTKTSPGIYLLVFLALVGLTITTVSLAHLDLGIWHTPVGLGIALTKALLVVLFFMHLWRGSRLLWLVALSGIFWLGLLAALTLSDFLTRDWL